MNDLSRALVLCAAIALTGCAEDDPQQFIEEGKPFLGICLGLQFLFTESEEFGGEEGLNIIPGRVVRFPSHFGKKSSEISQDRDLKVPHMGWNTIQVKKNSPLLKGIEDYSYFYFVHSYYVVPEDESAVCTTTDYGITFTSSIYQDNIFACQFHPEKSQSLGLKILKNFGDL